MQVRIVRGGSRWIWERRQSARDRRYSVRRLGRSPTHTEPLGKVKGVWAESLTSEALNDETASRECLQSHDHNAGMTDCPNSPRHGSSWSSHLQTSTFALRSSRRMYALRPRRRNLGLWHAFRLPKRTSDCFGQSLRPAALCHRVSDLFRPSLSTKPQRNQSSLLLRSRRGVKMISKLTVNGRRLTCRADVFNGKALPSADKHSGQGSGGPVCRPFPSMFMHALSPDSDCKASHSHEFQAHTPPALGMHPYNRT